MDDHRIRGLCITGILVGAIVMAVGLVGITGDWCHGGLYSCPGSRCTDTPFSCAGTVGYDIFLALIAVGGCVVAVSGIVLAWMARVG